MHENLQPYLNVSGQLCHHLGVLSDRQVEDILWVQAAAIELQKADPGLDFKPLSATQIMQAAANYGITKETIGRTRQTLGFDSFVPKGVPRFMEMAEKIGLRKKESNPVLSAQAAVRILEETEKLQSVSMTPPPTQWVQDFTKAAQERPWIGGKEDPPYLVSSQAVNQLAELLTVAVAKQPAMKDDPAIREATVALRILSAKAMKASAQEAEKANLPEVAQKMEMAAEQLLAGVGHSLRFAGHDDLIKQVDKGLETACNALEYGDGYKVGQRAQQRMQQARGLSGIVLERHQQIAPGYTSTPTVNQPVQYHYKGAGPQR